MCGQHWYLQFLSIHLTNSVHAFTCPLLWWWYDDDTACCIFSFVQNSLIFLETKLPPASDIVFLGSPCSKNDYMLVWYCLLTGLLCSWLLGTCYDNLQFKGQFCYIGRIYPHCPPPTVFLECHGYMNLSFSCICSNLRHVEAFMPIQYMDSSPSSFVFSSPFQYYAVNPWPVFVVLGVLQFICLSNKCHSSLPCHFWMSNIAFCFVAPHFCFLANLLWFVLLTVVGGCLWMLYFF